MGKPDLEISKEEFAAFLDRVAQSGRIHREKLTDHITQYSLKWEGDLAVIFHGRYIVNAQLYGQH